MVIAIDATPLTVPSGGVRRYVVELSRALAQRFAEDEFWLVSDQEFNRPDIGFTNLRVGRGPRNLMERRWWLWGLQVEMARRRIDVFHGTDFSVPYLPTRASVMTLHDLSLWMDPSWHCNAGRVRNRTRTILRLGLATMIITPSEAVRQQAIERFGLQASRVVHVPLAASSCFRPVRVPKADVPYLLYVGTLEPRKNLTLLLEAWREVRNTHQVDLVLAGRCRPDFGDIRSEPGLRVAGLVEDEELPKLYSGAVACVYPSFYEGFGLPVLEAMQCGAVVVASRDPAIAEVAGDGAVLVGAGEWRAWVEALRLVLDRSDDMQSLRERALARAAGFSWTATAVRTREVYVQAVERFRRLWRHRGTLAAAP